MRIKTVEYRRLASFGNYEHEEIGATAVVEDAETPEQAWTAVRGFVCEQSTAGSDNRAKLHELADLQRWTKDAEAAFAKAQRRLEKLNALLRLHDVPAVLFDADEVPF